MDPSMNHFIFNQLHVAQQSRREKLRVQHCSPSTSDHHVEVVQPGFNPILSQPGDDMRNSGDFFSTFCSNSHSDGMEDQASIAVNPINLASSNVDGSMKHQIENSMENYGVWKSVSANSNTDQWNTDCIGSYGKNDSQGIVSDIAALELRAKQNFYGHHQSQFQHGDMNLARQPAHYQNENSDGVTTAVIGLQPSIRWGRYSEDNENVRLAPYGYQSDIGWNVETSLLHSRPNQVVVDSQTQELSLSLCSYPAGSVISGTHFGNSHIPQPIPLHNVSSIGVQDTKPVIPNFERTSSLRQGNPFQKSVEPSTNYHRQPGPLGPFTGYSIILKGTRFLGPAQQLLDEYCGVIEKHTNGSTRAEASGSDISEFGDLAAAVNSIISGAVITGDIMCVSADTQQDSEDILKGDSSSPRESRRPDYQVKKVKLLRMLEEVCRKYKQYYQQMQMVVSSFESVAGLASATPYISSALKSVSEYFNHLKNALTDQLRHIKTFLRDDLSFQSGISDKADFNNKKLKYTEHSFQKHNSGGSNMGLLEPQQHIWRPQRGLPERAVSVLRTWLFEHFLHPYPTDTDKHMLATLTGLTRNQVSNWFINARVRLWKPMVEEVHMLETKETAKRNKNSAGDKNLSTNKDEIQFKSDHFLNKMVGCSVASVNLECPATGSLYEMEDVCVAKEYDQEKQSHIETHNMSSIDEGILNSSRSHQTGHEVSGLGSISLTLGLRQSAEQLFKLEGSQHLHYLQQQGHVRQHFGGHAMHDYTG